MFKMKTMLYFAFALILTIFLVNGVFALGVTPGRTTLNFESGKMNNFSFSILNSENKDFQADIHIEGDLKDYLYLSEDSISMKSNELSKKIGVSLDFPYYLSPGLHALKIFIVEKNDIGRDGTNLGAVVGVATEVNVLVSYPGKYLDADINAIGPNENGEINFIVPLINRGNQDISSASAVIDVVDGRGNKIESIETNTIDVPSGQRTEVSGKMVGNLPSGRYNLLVSVIYDGEILNFERTFVIGEPLLDLNELQVSDYKLGGIAKFEMLVENSWNEPINGAYANIKIYNKNGGTMAEFSSPVQDVPALGTVVFEAYWDSAGVPKDIYDAAISLIYNQKTSEKRFKLDIQDNKINVVGVSYVISSAESATINYGGIIILLVAAIFVLILINILWFIFLRKKLLRIKDIGK